MKFVICSLVLLAFAKAQEKDVVESVRADRDVALNVDIHSEFWLEARPIYAQVDPNGKQLNEYRTEVRSRWTSNSIYFLFVCPYQRLSLKPNPDAVHETYELWDWNVAEVFISSDFEDIKRYKEFEVSPQNEWIDLDINLHAPHHEEGWKWSSGFEHAAHIDEKKHVWYASVRIPFSALDSRPVRAGNAFRVNFYRTEDAGANANELMWQPVMSSTFHVPERFALLRLVEK